MPSQKHFAVLFQDMQTSLADAHKKWISARLFSEFLKLTLPTLTCLEPQKTHNLYKSPSKKIYLYLSFMVCH